SKKTGFSGEFLFRSSSEADEIASSRTGSGGTIVGSATGSGGAGGREDVPAEDVAGCGGAGRATGGGFFPHAVNAQATAHTITSCRTLIIESLPGCTVANSQFILTSRVSRYSRAS